MTRIFPLLIGFLFTSLFLAGCSSGLKVQLPKDMVSFKDTVKKMEFQLPPGWEQAPVDPDIEKSASKISATRLVGFRKADKGTLAVWCDKFDSMRAPILHMNDVIRDYTPLVRTDKPAEFFFEVDSPGSGSFMSRPHVRGYKATHILKGEKKEFLIILVMKEPPAVKLGRECTYMLFGRSASDEYSEEIKTDITAVAATLWNSGDR